MKGLICTKPGQLDEIKIVELPIVEPKAHQVQIAVKAAALSVLDFKPFSEVMRQGKVSFASKLLAGTKPFGGDIAGIVTKVGEGVTQIQPGDEVYASIGINGGCMELIVVDASKVCLKPTNLSFEEAAAIPTSGIVAMGACQKA